MKRNLYLLTMIMIFGAAGVYAQPNIFNPNDSVITYNSAKPPATPPDNTMAKWVRTVNRITNWNTNKFKPYIWNGMAFRLRFPNGYNAADTSKKYPVIIFLHGAGEIQKIYDDEDQLFWGAQPFQAKIDSGLFNAFLLFPQVSTTGWDYSYFTRINSVLDSMQKYVQADPDKVIAMGLSNGAFGSMSYAAGFPQRISTIIGASPALIQLIQSYIPTVIHIPTWLASGGQDTSPGPDVMKTYVDTFTTYGGDIRYNLYPTLSHDTWEQMWTEPYLVPYWKAAHTANPIIFNKISQYCPIAVTAHLGITQGFAEYQWQVNGNTIPNATTNDIIGTQLGSYRARFRRVAGGAWSDWSLVPAVITASPATASPSISVTGIKSVVLPSPDGSTTTPLELPAGYASYEWRKASDSSIVSTSRTFAAPVGQYIAKATNCNATFSPVFNVISATGTPRPDSARNLTLTRLTATSIKLNWSDVANPVSNETGFEIYRAAKAGGPYTMAGITGTDVKSFTDTAIANNYNFYYRIRSVNATGAAGLSNEASLQPAVDSIAPTVATNLRAILTTRNYIDLEWSASSDSVGVTSYDIYVNGTKGYTSIVPKISADGLTPNTAYTFTVVAHDQAGNSSIVSAPVTATSKLNGLKYHYYEGNWSVLPDFSTLTAVTSGATNNVDISVRPTGVIQNYGFVWEGFINIKVPGSYTFETSSDDGSKFYYNTFYSSTANALVNNDGVHGASPVAGTINITDTGLHPIAITYFQQASGQSMQVYWTGPGITRQLIPDAAFTETFVAPKDTTAPTAPAALKSAFTSRTYIDLSWTAATDSVGVTAYDVYINNVKKYTTTATAITADSLTPNVAYTFTIKARDFAGNTSAASNSLVVTTAATALKYKYYEGNWSVLPDFSTLTPVKTGSTANVDITVRPASVTQNYGFVWEGYINIKTPGVYTFETVSDDGSKLYFNSFYSPTATELVSNDGVHGAITVKDTINVTDTGMHPIAITYFQQSAGQSMQVYWTGPGIARQLIPDSAFTQSYKLATDVTAPTTPTGLKAVFLSNTSIDLTWTASTDNIGVVAYDIYVGGVKKYTSTTNAVTADSLTSNTSYTFTVKARDLAGNTSAASTSVVAKTNASAAGLKYSYYTGTWDVLPDFTTLTPVKTGTSANVDITVRPTGVTQYYGFLWQGYINIPTAGTYTFETVSDDGSKLYFNSQYVPTATATINNDGLHGATTVTATVTVSAAGYYPIAVTYFQKDGGSSMQVYWTGPGITRALIPSSAFVYQLPADNVAPTAPTNVTAASANSTYINLTWTASTDNVGVTGYDVYLNGTKKYTTTTNSVTADSLTAGTSYTFTVKAFDFAGNNSAASTALTTSTSTTASGLNYKYYEGTWDVLPNFNTLTPVKIGITPNVDITVRPATTSLYYGFTWQGYINLPAAGTYTFETVSDDGSKLYFNSQYVPTATALVNNDGLHGATTVTGTVTIATAGYYPIAITYFQKDGGQSMQVYWTGPSITRALIPNAAFIYQLPSDNVAPSVPTNVTAGTINSTFIKLSWTASTDNVGVTAYDVYVNGTKKYTTTTNSVTADSLTAGTSYTFTVKARDFAGNASAFSTALTTSTSTTATGLTYKYYEGNWNVLPDFSTLTPIKTGYTPNVDITTRNVDYYYGFVWEGNISLPTAGNYTFETVSDDGSKVYFNQKYSPTATALVNNDGVHGAISATGSVNVAAGVYPIAVTFFQQSSGASMQLYWTGPGIPRQLVPNSAFTGTFVLAADTVAPTVPANVKAILTTNTYVDIAWDASTDNIGVTGYDVYVNGVKKTTVTSTNYRLTGLTAGQSNTFTIKALDLANNASAFSTALAVVSSPKANGLKYRYYEGTWNMMPNFDTLAVVKTGSSATVDITVRPATVNYYYGFVWEGYINITTPGTYTFETVSDDGSRFYWNTLYNSAATPLVNNDGLHAATSVTGTVNIATAGLYPISVTYFQKDGGGSMALYYSGPGITRQLVPGTSFNVADGTATQSIGNGANATTSSVTDISSASDAAITAKITRAYPNPFTESITVQYANSAASSNVSVGVYDMGGRLVKRQAFGGMSAGVNTLIMSLDKQMIPGMYLVTLDVDGKQVKMWKMIKQKK